MARVVRETVVAGAGVAEVVAGAADWVCADATAAAKKRMARDRFFTQFSIRGKTQGFLIIYMLRDTEANEKNKKG